MRIAVASEQRLQRVAAAVALSWQRNNRHSLLIGLNGELGAGKTTWTRAMLRALGHRGAVPSPTYTLIEPYRFGSLDVIHLDLYRLASDDDLEHLGIRDLLANADVWLIAEWPSRAPGFAARCDLQIEFEFGPGEERILELRAQTAAGRDALRDICDLNSNYDS